MNKSQKEVEQIIVAINDCRFVVLRAVEFELEGSPSWDVVRSRILRAFGNKGLMGQINQILFHPSVGGEK